MEGDPLNFRPPVLVGERVAWMGSGTCLPQGAIVRWIGRVPEITNGWTVGIELDQPMPFGGIDGTWCKRKLFSCEPKHGLLVPIDKIVKETSLLSTRHSLGESFYSDGVKQISERNRALLRKLSLPQSQNPQEFLSKVLPAVDRLPKNNSDEVPAVNFKAAASRYLSEKHSIRSIGRARKSFDNSSTSLEEETDPDLKLSPSRQRSILRTFSLEKPKVAPLSVENVKSLEGCTKVEQDWAATCEEWERFKKYLDTVGNFQPNESSKERRKKIGINPNSLYALAKPEQLLETSLALRLIGERKDKSYKGIKEDLVIKEESFENSLTKENEDDFHKDGHSSNEPLRKDKYEDASNETTQNKCHEDNLVLDSRTIHRNKAEKSIQPSESFAQNDILDAQVTNQTSGSDKKVNCQDQKLVVLAKNSVVSYDKLDPICVAQPARREHTVKKVQYDTTNGNLVLNNSTECSGSKENTLDCKFGLVASNGTSSNVNSVRQKKEKFAEKENDVHFPVEDTKKIKTDSAVQTRPTRTKKRNAQLKSFNVKEATLSELPVVNNAFPFESVELNRCQAGETIEGNSFEGTAVASQVEILFAEAEESVPAPTLRRKRQPVPAPRRKQKDDRRREDDSDTASILYEPAFLRAYCDGEPSYSAMTDVQGTFRRIEEDDIERPVFNNHHRLLSASVSTPETSKKGLFSFLRWFKKNKHVEDLDLNALNSASVASSPVFPHNARIAGAESVETLYSIATASSFAFVSASQYQRERNVGAEQKKKRRAPQPPLRRDASLPNTLEFRGRISHRRSASESYKDKQFAHVQGKRKAPPPPSAPPRLYPTLSSVRDPYPSLLKKKRPAPLPPEQTNGVLVQEDSIVVTENPQEIDAEDAPPETSPLAVPDSNIHVEPSPTSMGVSHSEETVVCNDTLKLERGVLKPTKTQAATPDVAKVIPLSPVSPRPWYKRKSLEKRKEKVSEDWMPELGFSRPGLSPDVSPLKLFFTRSHDDKKKEEKRKSGISMLANISELDREAAEICKREQEQQQQKIAADDAKFYGNPVDILAGVEEYDGLKKTSTRELITLFNNIGSVTKVSLNTSFFPRYGSVSSSKLSETSGKDLAVGVVSTPEIKTAAVVGTKNFVIDEPKPSSSKIDALEDVEPVNVSVAKVINDLRNQRHHSPSPTISTIAELSEPSSSAATTMNQYAEPVWKCTRCTLENTFFRNRCEACSACKPNYNPVKNAKAVPPFERRKSEMDLEIDWEQELQKYFPSRMLPKEQEISSKLILSKSGDVDIKTEVSQLKEDIDIDEVRKRRMAFFMKSLGNEISSLRDAAAKKSLDESEKLKLKGMLKEMKESLPKREAINNAPSKLNSDGGSLPVERSLSVNRSSDEASKYGAIRKIKKDEGNKAEAMLITTTTVFEDIIVRKNKVEKEQQTSPVVEIPVQNFTTVGLKSGEHLKKARRIGDGPFELLRARDLANIIETKTGSPFPAHVYANLPAVRQSEASESNGEDEEKLTTAAGLAKFKASLDPSATNTIAVNRLLRQLEGAIADGRHDQAAALARDLAVLKVSCSVVRQRPSPSPSPTAVTVEMYVEDKLSHQGPIPLQLQRSMTLLQLKNKIGTDFQIPNHVQRWILGKRLATDDDKTLEELGVTEDRCPIFLYLVAPENEINEVEAKPSTSQDPVKQGSPEGAVGVTPNKKSPPRGKGWYYNYEEDRYSFCGSESDQSPEKEIPVPPKVAARQVIQRTIEAARGGTKPPANETSIKQKEEVITAQPVFEAKPFQPRPQRPPLTNSQSLPEEDLHREEASAPKEPLSKEEVAKISEQKPSEESSSASGKNNDEKGKKIQQGNPVAPSNPRPRSRSIFDLMKPQSNDTLKKDLKMISVNVKETIEMLSRRSEDITRQGWRCATCTLVNTATRPGCAACTSPRPPGYAPPPPRPAEDELRRLRRDQSMDIPLKEPEQPTGSNQTYLQLMNLDNADVVTNTEDFECPVCLTVQQVGEGVVLRECLHNFCRACLGQTIQYNEEAEVKCPFRDDNYTCETVLQEREIKALVSREVWEQHLARGVSQAENKIGNAFHCKTPDCRGWCIVEDNVNEYKCPVCRHTNCLTCQTIHEGLDCRQYQERLTSNSETDAEAKRTRSMLEEMVQRGDAMACPTCQVVLMKKWGCDWLRCSMCKTEICWVTRGPRWGPAGKGDTSAGCQCGINGVKCHPKCNYCH